MSAEARLQLARNLITAKATLKFLEAKRQVVADHVLELKAELETAIDEAIEAGETHAAPCLPELDYRVVDGSTKVVFRTVKTRKAP